MTRRTITPPPPMPASIVLHITEDGKLYDRRGRVVCELQPGELIRLNSTDGEYSIIVHRQPNKKPAKVLRLVR